MSGNTLIAPATCLRAWPRRLMFWVRRYLPAELAGAATMLLAGLVAANLGAPAPLIAIAAVAGENVGFYGTLAINVYREQRAHNPGRRRRSVSRRVVLLLSA